MTSALKVDRVPRPQPFNPEAEQRLLGAILVDNQVYHRVAQLLCTDDFGNALHSRVFAALGKLITEGREANPVLLKNLFDHDEALKSNGGGTYLAHLASWAAMVTNPEDYATAIRELAVRRQIIEACEMARDDAYRVDPVRPAGRIIQEHTARLTHANSATALAELPQCTKLRDWLQRDLAAPDFLLGNVLSTTSRMMLIGRTGLGKTNFAMALALAIAKGDPFLHWNRGKGPRRVLFIDGEMSNRQLKKRLEDAARRADGIPDDFHALCRDDFPKMEPLDSEAGQRFMDCLIESIGGADLVVFDNVDALTADDDDFGAQSWQRTLPWIRDLTRRAISQLWLHHTGQDESRGYGSKKREWPLDIVAVMEDIDCRERDVAFQLKFTKARERTPDNRTDFEPAVISLSGDAWTSERGGDVRTTRRTAAHRAFELLKDAIAREGIIPPANTHIPPDTYCVTEGLWRRYCEAGSISEGSPDAAKKADADRKAFKRATDKLIGSKVGKWELWVWIIR